MSAKFELNNSSLNDTVARSIYTCAQMREKKAQDNEMPTFVNKYSKNDDAAYAQQIVHNNWCLNMFEIDESFRQQAIRSLSLLFNIRPDRPLTITLYHDCCITPSERSVTSVAELVDNMIENYQEFEE